MPKGKTQRNLDLIEAARDILEAIHPASVRAVCYQLFIRKLLPSMAKTCTNRVSTQLVYARKAGIIPWSWIVDETRDIERPGTWANPETFIPAVMRSYRRDRWAWQTHRVEVWSGKGTIRGTLAPLLQDYGVNFQVIHGHTSWTQSHDAAEECRADPRPGTILYVGDYDPSGMHMSEVDLPENRFAWEGVNDLRATVKTAIEDYIDWDNWLRCDTVEAAEQRSLRQILGTWRTVLSGQASI